ncbi:MAG: hypothetical protein KJ964_10690 [Verrucomicrobia bacterium]|nr:hypothetical protein [Verrucomicrobiota bacterium]MBU1735358.1 hypothetical protein [Verrucomicrobiota bacterium]MBU1857487.1 hypothetical protein [Verrucomicrobiota bacterium]
MKSSPANDPARRAYWRDQMNAAWILMSRFMEYPVQECGEPMVSLRMTVERAGVRVLFSETPVVNLRPRLFYLRAGLIDAFVAVTRAMNRHGWMLKVEDGYRTRAIQTELGRTPFIFDRIYAKILWETGGQPPSADLVFKRLTALVATVPKIGTHMSGSAMDISVVNSATGLELTRGGIYPELSELTPMGSPFISAEERSNRAAITEIMQDQGFMAYPHEFWHYSQGDAYAELLTNSGRTARYGAVDCDPEKNPAVIPIKDPRLPLHTPEEIESAIRKTRERLAEQDKDLNFARASLAQM